MVKEQDQERSKIDTSGTEKLLKEEQARREAEEKEIELNVPRNNVTIGDCTYMKGDKVKVTVGQARTLQAQGVLPPDFKLPEMKEEPEPDPLSPEERKKSEDEIKVRAERERLEAEAARRPV